MTDPFDGLRSPRRPLADGADLRVIARGQRVLHRRRVAYGGIVGAGVLAIGAVATLDSGGQDKDSVRYLDPNETPSPSAAPAETEPTPTSSPRLPAVVPTQLASLLPGVGQSPPPPPPSESPEPDPEPTEPPVRPYVGQEPLAEDGGPIMTRTMANDPTYCAKHQQVGPYQQAGGAWCGATSGPTNVFAGKRSPFSFTVCRPASAGAGVLHFRDRHEVWFQVGFTPDSGDEQIAWTWGKGFDFPSAPHQVDFAAGDCATWSITWSGEGDDGYALDEGAYEVDSFSTATDFGGDPSRGPIGYTGVQLSWQ
jgi:hypothetical protein